MGKFSSIVKIHFGRRIIFAFVGTLRMESEYELERCQPSAYNSWTLRSAFIPATIAPKEHILHRAWRIVGQLHQRPVDTEVRTTADASAHGERNRPDSR